MKSVFITGDEGFIGSYLKAGLSDYFKVGGCDIRSGRDFVNEVPDADIIIHTAGLVSVPDSEARPIDYIYENIAKLGYLLNRNPGKKIIFLSTGGAIYGDKIKATEEDASIRVCKSTYAVTKYLGEQLVFNHSPNNLILRLGVVTGANEDVRSVPNVFTHFANDNPITVYGANQIRDFVPVEQVLQAILRGIDLDAHGVYNIGSGTGTKINTLAEYYAKKRKVPITHLTARSCEVDYITLDCSKAKEAGLL